MRKALSHKDLQPGDPFKVEPRKKSLSPRERRRLTVKLLRRALRHKQIILVGFVSMLLAAAAQTAPIGLAKVFVDQVLMEVSEDSGTTVLGRDLRSFVPEAGRALAGLVGVEPASDRAAALLVVVLAIASVALIAAGTTFLNEFISKYLAARVVADLRGEMMRKVLRLPLGWFSRRRMGDLISRFSTDTQVTFRTVNIFFSIMLLQPLILLFALGAAMALNWRLTVASMVLFPLVVIPLRHIGQRVTKRSRKSLDTLGETVEAVNQVLSGQRVVKAFRMEDAEEREFQRINDKWVSRQASLQRAKALNRAVVNLLDGFTVATVLAIGGSMVIHQKWGLTPANLTGFLVAMAYLFRPIRRLSVAYNNWQESISAAGRLFEVLDTPEIAPDPPEARSIGRIRKGLVFEDVWFSFDNEGSAPTPVLRGVSFQIPASNTVALVGPSGSGKSTIADLIFRFYEPTRGRILIDDVPLDSISRESLYREIAVVAQQPFIFNTTIRANIAYGRPEASLEEIQEAARAACIHEEILALPEGYDTVVGDRGATLSGGQLQRITIARAILKNASFLLLDEATSNLDAASELAVQEALSNLMRGRTSLVIAHRLSTIVDADHILVIKEGRIVEQGTHQELVAREGAYHQLYRLQLGG